MGSYDHDQLEVVNWILEWMSVKWPCDYIKVSWILEISFQTAKNYELIYNKQGWGAGAGCFGAGAALKKTRSRSRFEKSQEPEQKPLKN